MSSEKQNTYYEHPSTVKQDLHASNSTVPKNLHTFFTTEEMATFLKDDYKTILLYMDNGMPYLDYVVSKKVFESIVGGNYSLEILSKEFLHEFDTYMVHVRFTMTRGDKTVSKDVIGCEKAKRNKDNEIVNFHNLPKSAVKDAFKKFLNDYIGIGASQYMAAKKEYEENAKRSKGGYNNNYSQNTNQVYTCSDCNVQITPKIYTYSVNYHQQKRPLCTNCQKKY